MQRSRWVAGGRTLLSNNSGFPRDIVQPMELPFHGLSVRPLGFQEMVIIIHLQLLPFFLFPENSFHQSW